MARQIDWQAGEEHLQKMHPVFSCLIEKYGHCTLRPVLPERYYATLIKGILAQQVASDISQNLFTSFTRTFGPAPDAEQILDAGNDQLKGCGISEQKIQYINDLSQNIKERKIIPEEFDMLDDNAIIKQLSNIRGLGRWTVEIFLILALNRQDVLPADDFGLKKAAQVLFDLPQLPQKRSQLTALSESWRPWRSLATWYLWQSFTDM